MIEFIPNGVGINAPDDYAIWMFFIRKLRCSELNSLLSEVLVTLLEEKKLSSDYYTPLLEGKKVTLWLLHPSGYTPLTTTPLWLHSSGQFRLTIPQLVKLFKYLTKLSRSLFEPFGFKCKRLLFKCFLGLIFVLLIKGISLLSHKSFK